MCCRFRPRSPAELRVLIEPLSVAVHGVARGAPLADERAVVIGAGAIGLFTALVLRDTRAPRDRRRRVEPRSAAARRGLRVHSRSTRRARASPTRSRALVRPEGADCVFECAGSQDTIAAAIIATRKGGRTIIVGNAPPMIEIDGLALQRGDRTIIGVLMYDLADFTTAMDLLADGILDGIPLDEIVTHYTLDRIADAFVDAKSGRLVGLKAVIEL